MRNLFLCIALFCVSITFSQSKPFKISGQLIASDDQSQLEAATVYLQRVKDSSLVTYTISDKKGGFVLEDETSDSSLNLYVSYVGYKTYFQNIKLDKREINLETIPLEVSNALDEVVIKSVAPVTIKKDTLEFNVKSFKTKKDANVEDLLKQLPGVEIDEDGKIKVNGKEVNKILVNGKPFFGNDPTITTKNLTKDIIEKIQIVDTKTKSEAYAGESGDNKNKTINLTIKEENNKGVFGRVSAGGGTNERYEFAGLLNVFDNDRRVSVLAGGNNTNSPGFSFGEISKMFGRGGNTYWSNNGSFSINGRRFGGGQGITRSQNAGANYADKLAENVDISADYFFSGSHSDDAQSSERETILSDSRYYSNSASSSINETQSHNANLEFDIEIDSTFLINIKPFFSASKTTTDYNDLRTSLNNDKVLTNKSSTNSLVENTGKEFKNSLSFTKKFGAGGAFLKANVDFGVNQTEGDDYLFSNTEVFGDNPETEIRNQFTDEEGKINQYEAGVSYRLPIVAKEFFIDFEYHYETNEDNNKKSTFDYNNSTEAFDQFNTALSTDFKYVNTTQSPGIGLTYKKEKWSTSLSTNYVKRTLENEDALRSQFNEKRDFENIELDYNLNYRFSKKTSVYFNYDYRNEPPILSQLQAFEDVSNPLNTIVGNPNLSPTRTHGIYANFNSYDWQKKSGIWFYISSRINDNDITSKSIVDPETLKRSTTYENVDGSYQVNGGGRYSKNFKLDSIRKIRVKIGAWTNFSKRINFNNDVEYASNRSSITPNLAVDFIWNKVMELKPYYRVSLTNNKYDIEAFDDRNFISHSAGIKTATFLPKKLEWRNDIRFSYNPDVADGFQKSAWFWNASLAYSVLKDKGTITLKAYDLLNQNTNAKRTATNDYIEDSRSTVLNQYFMLSFSWKFNSLGKKGETRKHSFDF